MMKKFGKWYINFNNVNYIDEKPGSSIQINFIGNSIIIIDSNDEQYEAIREYINNAF